MLLYDGDLPGAQTEVHRWEREGVRLFGVGGVGSELVEWEWGGPGASKEVGRVKVRNVHLVRKWIELTKGMSVDLADAATDLCARGVEELVPPRDWL